MKDWKKMKSNIKLNHKCIKCKKAIYLGECIILKEGAYHITCLLQKERNKFAKDLKRMLKEKKSWTGNELFEDIDRLAVIGAEE